MFDLTVIDPSAPRVLAPFPPEATLAHIALSYDKAVVLPLDEAFALLRLISQGVCVRSGLRAVSPHDRLFPLAFFTRNEIETHLADRLLGVPQ